MTNPIDCYLSETDRAAATRSYDKRLLRLAKNESEEVFPMTAFGETEGVAGRGRFARPATYVVVKRKVSQAVDDGGAC